MTTAWIVAIVSVAGLLATVLLLKVEEKKGHRLILRRARAACDLFILKIGIQTRKLWKKMGGSLLRRALHFSVNKFLWALLYFLRSLETMLKKLQQANQQVASTNPSPNLKSHLGEMREYKSTFSLSPEEKRQKRRELLE